MRQPEPSLDLSDDATISAAVHALLQDAGESVADLAFHTRISTASLYRKLNGPSPWRVADVGAIARRYRIQPGDLFLGPAVLSRPRPAADQDAEGETASLCAIRDSNPEPADSVAAGCEAIVIPFPARPSHGSDVPARAAGWR